MDTHILRPRVSRRHSGPSTALILGADLRRLPHAAHHPPRERGAPVAPRAARAAPARGPSFEGGLTVMDALFRLLITNAAAAGLLAVGAWVASRLVKRPAVVHGLWLLALAKLVTPPPVPLPVLPGR